MNARSLSRIMSIISIVSVFVVIVYSIIVIGMLKTNISGITNKDVINEKITGASSTILIVGGIGCVISFFASLFATMTYTMVGNVFKPDKLFLVKIVFIFVPMFVIIIIFVILSSMVVK